MKGKENSKEIVFHLISPQKQTMNLSQNGDVRAVPANGGTLTHTKEMESGLDRPSSEKSGAIPTRLGSMHFKDHPKFFRSENECFDSRDAVFHYLECVSMSRACWRLGENLYGEVSVFRELSLVGKT